MALLLSACGLHPAPDVQPPAPLQVACRLEPCVEEQPPAWPSYHKGQRLDSPDNVAALLEMEALLRDYVARLRGEVGCYRRQVAGQGLGGGQ